MASEGEGPSPDEVQRWVNKLYDRAESDTGRYNATRAASIPRRRSAVTRGQSQEDVEPAAGTFARKWFDSARAALGPIVPARLPDSRLPARPERAPESVRPVRPAERPAEPLALEAPKQPEPPKPLTGVARELTIGTAQPPATGSLPEIPAQRVAPALPGESRRDESAWPGDVLPVLGGDAAAWPLYEPGPAPVPAPALEPSPLSGPQLTMTLPTVPDPTTAPHYASVPPADLTTTAYDAGLPEFWTSAVASPTPTPTPAPAPAAPTEPAAAPASSAGFTPAPSAGFTPAPSTTFAPGAYGGPWPSPDSGHRTRAERVIAFARAQAGRPCVTGAVGPGSYDAPGLTQAAWKAAGVTLPRTTQAQWAAGTQVSLADAQVGDLVFFHDDLGHVGIWSGDGMMIHAPGPGALIREESVFFAGQSAIKGAIRPA
ncbi:NlpC/P60 family protein [Streptomyces koelreuteriae]|uniref:C40 family peptidase n=1 Tax=Streptomyces koelreuteriae TaxID=2838015 RepID=UPI003EB88485